MVYPFREDLSQQFKFSNELLNNFLRFLRFCNMTFILWRSTNFPLLSYFHFLYPNPLILFVTHYYYLWKSKSLVIFLKLASQIWVRGTELVVKQSINDHWQWTVSQVKITSKIAIWVYEEKQLNVCLPGFLIVEGLKNPGRKTRTWIAFCGIRWWWWWQQRLATPRSSELK